MGLSSTLTIIENHADPSRCLFFLPKHDTQSLTDYWESLFPCLSSPRNLTCANPSLVSGIPWWLRAWLWNSHCLGWNPNHVLAVRPWANLFNPSITVSMTITNMWVMWRRLPARSRAQYRSALIIGIDSWIFTVRPRLVRLPSVSDLYVSTPLIPRCIIIHTWSPCLFSSLHSKSPQKYLSNPPSSPSPPPVPWFRASSSLALTTEVCTHTASRQPD